MGTFLQGTVCVCVCVCVSVCVYAHLFDGSSLLVPMISPQHNSSAWPVLGGILSHAYLACGFLPVRVALPCLVGILCGLSVVVPPEGLCMAFLDYIFATESSI